MMNVWQLKKATDEIIRDYNDEISNILESLEENIADLNREQLSKGLTSDGKKIGDKPPFYHPYYFPRHEGHRIAKGLEVGFINLNWSGKFYDSIFSEVKNEKVIVFSKDNQNKVNALMYGGGSGEKSLCGCKRVREGGFGTQIFGLTENNKLIIRDIVKQRLNQWAINKLKQ